MRTPLPLGFLALATLASLFLAAPATAQVAKDAKETTDAQDAAAAKRKRLKDDAADFWIYDDVDKGYARAAETGKPLLVSFRCVP